MSYGDDVIDVAFGEIGITEDPPNSNLQKYGAWYGKNGVAWCVIFCQWCYAQAGYKLPYKTASVSDLLAWYKKKYPKLVVDDPSPGDIVLMNIGQGHAGIYQKKISENLFYTIEGNTSMWGSQDNGGAVLQRVRNTKDVRAFIHPFEDKNMKVVKGETSSETKMIKAIQTAIKANADGQIGAQTMSDLACIVGAECFPLTVKIYDAPVIIANDIIPFPGKGATLKSYSNCINGSFYAGGMPCSINVYDGFTTQRYACHATYGKPETVIYKLRTGEIGIRRVLSTDELPSGVQWAVGGMGLLDYYDPTAEGFCKLTRNGKTEDFSDVLRKTNHAVLGVKNGKMYLVYCASMTASGVNGFARKLGLEKAIMLDGGSVAGMNGAESFARINTNTKQYYIIQGVK